MCCVFLVERGRRVAPRDPGAEEPVPKVAAGFEPRARCDSVPGVALAGGDGVEQASELPIAMSPAWFNPTPHQRAAIGGAAVPDSNVCTENNALRWRRAFLCAC